MSQGGSARSRRGNGGSVAERRGLDHFAADLLKSGDYEGVADLLSRAQTSPGGAMPAPVPETIRGLIHACCEYRAQADWHRHAFSQAHQRELESVRELQTTLALLTPEPDPRPEPLLAAAACDPAPGGDAGYPNAPSEPSPMTSLILGLRRLLGWSPPAPALLADPPSAVAETALPQFPRGEVRDPLLDSPAMQDQPATPSCSRNHAQSNNQSPPSLDIHFLGPLRVFANDCPIEDWPNCKGKAVFKYLVTHRERPVPRDVLMEQFWPSSGADAARNSLNVAVYGLRKILAKAHPAFSFVLFQDGSYSLNPELQIWVDSEAFLHHLRLGRELERRGQEELAIHEYRAAEVLYQDEFLVEDRYEDWLVPLRQRFRDQYLTVLERLSGFYFDKREHETCAMLCTKMLAVDPCNEEPHRRLMRCYSRLGQPHLALRQYHVCRDTLDRELNLAPGQETTELLARIQRGQVA